MAENFSLGKLGLVQIIGLSLALGFAAIPVQAIMVEVKLPTPPVKVTSSSLKKLKALESEGKFTECARLAASVYQSQSLVRGWVLRTWLKCAAASDKDDKKISALPAALRVYDRFSVQSSDLWADDLRQQMIEARLWMLETFGKTSPGKNVDEHLAPVMRVLTPRETEFQARAWVLLGDLSQLKHDLAGAETAFQQALKYNEQPATLEKLKAVRLALNRTEPKAVLKPAVAEALSDNEARFEARFQASKEKNDLLLQLEDSLAYLKELPNGLKAKWAEQNCLEIHQTLLNRSFEGSTKERWRTMLERAVGLMDNADPERLIEWAPIIYRRGDYAGSLRLSEVIVDRYSKTSVGDQVLWYAARAAQLTGDYKKAEKYFANFFERHGGSDLALDAEFQWAMTLIRNGNPASAVARLEKLLRSPGSDRYDLSARYWMVRSLQALNNPRAAEEIKIIAMKYPASYYGIRLVAESQNNQFEWPFTTEKLKGLKGSMRLSPRQKAAWDRLLVLRSHGWISEALSETEELPLPEDPTLKVLWAQELVKAEAYPKVIRLVNEVGDTAPELRSLDVLALAMPKNYQAEIIAEGKKRSLHPILIRSLIRQESAFNPRAVSRSKAMGLMQLIPGTAREVATALKLGPLMMPEDVFRVGNNVQMGSAYLARMIRYFSGSVPLGLAAYNAGPRRMEAFLAARPELRESLKTPSSDPMTEVWFDELPWSETSFYVKAILRNSLLYKTLDQRKIILTGVLWGDLAGPGTEGVADSTKE